MLSESQKSSLDPSPVKNLALTPPAKMNLSCLYPHPERIFHKYSTFNLLFSLPFLFLSLFLFSSFPSFPFFLFHHASFPLSSPIFCFSPPGPPSRDFPKLGAYVGAWGMGGGIPPQPPGVQRKSDRGSESIFVCRTPCKNQYKLSLSEEKQD